MLDCSVALTWAFEDEQTQFSAGALDKIQAESAVVPGHFHLEICNALWAAERQERISIPESDEFLALIDELPIGIDRETADYAGEEILALARRRRLSPYDAAYVELATRTDLPLLTNDESMIRAATAEQVPVIRG